MARDLKQSGSAGSKDRMKKMTDKVYDRNTVTEGTSGSGSKITYRDKYKSGKRYPKKSVRLEKDADGKTYKSNSKKGFGSQSSNSLERNKKEISEKKYNRNRKRVEKVKSKGAKTKILRGSKEDMAQQKKAKAAKKEKAFDYTQNKKDVKSKYKDDIVVLGDESKSTRRKQTRATKKNKKQLKRLGLSQTKY